MKTHLTFVKECFLTVMAQSSYPAITSNDFLAFFNKCKVIDQATFNISAADRVHIASGVKIKDNPNFSTQGNALVRFEFFESLVRIAQQKYKEQGAAATFRDALQMLLSENVMKYGAPEPWQAFRDEELWSLDVNDLIEANLPGLKKIYESFFSPVKKWMTMDDAILLCITDSPTLALPEKDVCFAFAMSKMTVAKESANYINYQQMKFVEFLEFVGRLADLKFKGSADAALPLA